MKRTHRWYAAALAAGVAPLVAACTAPLPSAHAPTTVVQSATSPSTEVRVTTTAPADFAVTPALDRLSRPRPGVVLPRPREDLTTHGGFAAGVYFAVLTGPQYGDTAAGLAQLRAAELRLRQNFAGKYFGNAQTTCDLGATDAFGRLGIHGVIQYVVLHFPTMDEAARFAAGVDPAPLVVASVETYCRDGVPGG